MIALLQRVSQASVKIAGQKDVQINQGFLVFLGITEKDSSNDMEWLSKKIVGMRVFSDEQGKMNLDLKQVVGDILLISQFTLHASTKKGNRPSFINAAKPAIAFPLYEAMGLSLSEKLGKTVKTGIFGADMKVSLINDGPVTIILDSHQRR